MSRVAVVIPLYKKELSKYEQISILQCFKVLSSYDIIFFSFNELLENFDFRAYVPGEYVYKTVDFDAEYFSSFAGYNKLLVSEDFYRRFSLYNYILIYQPDAFVFSDQLSEWCSKGFDYIGAPWFKKCGGDAEDGLWAVGNGGFSLRNVQGHLDLLKSTEPFYSGRELVKEIISPPYTVGNLKTVIKKYHRDNNIIYKYIAFAKQNEDGIIGEAGIRSRKFKLPSVNESIPFSFDRHPEYMYKLNGSKLPFGCHAWFRNDEEYRGNFQFWKPFIEEAGYLL